MPHFPRVYKMWSKPIASRQRLSFQHQSLPPFYAPSWESKSCGSLKGKQNESCRGLEGPTRGPTQVSIHYDKSLLSWGHQECKRRNRCEALKRKKCWVFWLVADQTTEQGRNQSQDGLQVALVGRGCATSSMKTELLSASVTVSTVPNTAQ